MRHVSRHDCYFADAGDAVSIYAIRRRRCLMLRYAAMFVAVASLTFLRSRAAASLRHFIDTFTPAAAICYALSLRRAPC